jgi:beta-glucanase (GH16 family)
MTVSKPLGSRSRTSQSLKTILALMATLAWALLLNAAGAELALAAATPGGGSWDMSQRGAALDLSGYKLSFDDEFNSLDLACWQSKPLGSHHWYIYNTGSSGIASTPCASGFGANVSVSGGVLSLTARRQGGVWTTGAIQSMDMAAEGFKQQYGYFSARIKLPAATPKGVDLWPSFWVQSRWTLPGSYEYPELDVLEAWSVTTKGRNEVTLHAWPASPADPAVLPAHQQAPLATGSAAFDGKWHVYGVRFTPNFWTVYLDGAEWARYPVNASYMNKPVYPILDLAVSPSTASSGAPASYTMYVDYVRVYICTISACRSG